MIKYFVKKASPVVKTAIGPKEKEAAISINGLCKSFDELKVLDGISFDLLKGENIVVLGRSGSGKSVLLKLISGLLEPDSGNIVVLGQDIGKLTKKGMKQLRLKIGFIFQAGALYDSMSVQENLAFSLAHTGEHMTEREMEMKIKEVLESVDLPNTARQMPTELSGGQKKRIAIARTLILHPEIMLYDEPTGGLDPTTSIEINNLIKKVQSEYNTSAIIITHDLTCAKTTGDRIFMLSDGHFIKQGSFDEVFSSDDTRIKSFYDYNFTS